MEPWHQVGNVPDVSRTGRQNIRKARQMNFKKTLYTTTAAVILSAGMAMSQGVTDTIIADLQAQNATNIKVKVTLFGQIKVEAIIDGVKVERTYASDGTLRKEEIVSNGTKVKNFYDENGNLIRSVTDDDDEDDDDEDDDDEDDDDEDDDDEDDDDDDDEDDDRDDDDNDDDGEDDDD
jgi:hypothetical protein